MQGKVELQVSHGDVYLASFDFNSPATDEEIKQLENDYEVVLPKEYKEFLKIHNGAKLFDIGYGECTRIFSIEEVYDVANTMPEISSSLLPFASYPSIMFYLDLTREKKYIFSNESSPDFNFFSQNFTEWLSAIIQANGRPFWDWTPQMLYRTIDNTELRVKDWLIKGFE
nr:SMI1/KNR4 family protein [Paenibacillus caui]